MHTLAIDVMRDATRSLDLPARFHPTALELPDDLPYDEWERLGVSLLNGA